MADYFVAGPFEVPVELRRAGRTIDRSRLPEFWKRVGPAGRGRGCYVFAIRSGRATMPVYVGKSARPLEDECFTPHKLAEHYYPAMADYAKGTPVLFLVVQKSRKGKPNRSEIEQVERFLVQVGEARNPELSNVHLRNRDEWSIDGVVRHRRGKPAHAAKQFKKMMGLE